MVVVFFWRRRWGWGWGAQWFCGDSSWPRTLRGCPWMWPEAVYSEHHCSMAKLFCLICGPWPSPDPSRPQAGGGWGGEREERPGRGAPQEALRLREGKWEVCPESAGPPPPTPPPSVSLCWEGVNSWLCGSPVASEGAERAAQPAQPPGKTGSGVDAGREPEPEAAPQQLAGVPRVGARGRLAGAVTSVARE